MTDCILYSASQNNASNNSSSNNSSNNSNAASSSAASSSSAPAATLAASGTQCAVSTLHSVYNFFSIRRRLRLLLLLPPVLPLPLLLPMVPVVPLRLRLLVTSATSVPAPFPRSSSVLASMAEGKLPSSPLTSVCTLRQDSDDALLKGVF